MEVVCTDCKEQIFKDDDYEQLWNKDVILSETIKIILDSHSGHNLTIKKSPKVKKKSRWG